MIISLDRRFVFIANLNCASTPIEDILRKDSEITILESRFGKHLPYRLIEEYFFWIFQFVPKHKLFVFGVMRDPVDYLISLFNSHRDEKYKTSPDLYTGDMLFEDFIWVWRKNNEDQMVPQHTRFLDGGGAIAANYIIDLEELSDGLAVVGKEIGVDGLSSVQKTHVSQAFLKREMLSAKQLAWAYRTYWRDFEFLRISCNKIIR